MLAINEILQERYRIVRQLGQGGMGAIYVAEDSKRFGKLVALKEILIDLGKLPDQKQRDLFRRAFEREAKILTQLEHEAFPQVVDYFLETNRQFLVMELIQGEDLGEILDKNQTPFQLEEVLNWTQQLLDALDYLHTLTPPVIHRDIKPQNLKVTTRGKVKLLDFGIATGSTAPLHTTITNSTFIAATLHYSPLEQIIKVIDVNYRELLVQKFGERLSKIIPVKSDASSDIYALGATLYHLLTAHLPADALQRILQTWEGKSDPLINPREANPKIPQAISDWLLKAMAIERENRFASALEMQTALREAVFREEEARRGEEREKLKRERESFAQERQNFEAERLFHWRQIEEEQKRQAAERELQRQNAELQNRNNLNQDIAETQPSFPLPATKSSPEISISERNKISDEKTGEPNLKDNSSSFTEVSYLPDDFQTKKEAEVKPDFKITNENSPLVDESENKFAKLLPVAAVGLLLLIVASFAVWIFSGNSGDAKVDSKPDLKSGSKSNPANISITTPEAPQNMAYIPGGEFMMGNDDGKLDGEKPAHKVSVQPFFMDIYETTNEQYLDFVKATNHTPPSEWKNGSYPNGQAKFPVVGVDWTDANAFCKNAGKRLPTEEEWEFAARGTNNFLYPWGNSWESNQANIGNKSFSEVGKYPGKSPFGIYDMIGNAGEWTASDFKAYPGGKLSDAFAGKSNLKTVRGGSIDTLKDYATATYRIGLPAIGAGTYDRTGFRCVQDVK